jgi:malonate-semialdehyde dehydrogenase (acetylating) / methylmalonate-semialdehyde dehydrogenase
MAFKVSTDYGTLELLIDGKWRRSSSGQKQAVYDPGRGTTIAEVPFAAKEEVATAVESSGVAFEKWSRLPFLERVEYLFRMKSSLEGHFEELAAMLTQNHGKTLEESRGEVRRTIENVEAAIATAYTLAKGETLDQVAEGIDEQMVKEPLGVFAVISPFNFPLMVPFWFLPYAVVLGDTVVLKPSEIDPVPTTHVVKLLTEEAKLPPGVVNVVQGSKDVAEALITHKDIQGVTFVGSTPVAKHIYSLAGQNGKRAIVNGGAKNSVVVMPDAPVDSAIPAIISSFFGNSGQRCLAGSNLISVGRESNGDLLAKFIRSAQRVQVGYGLEPSTEMGPVISKAAKSRIEGFVESGITDGAKLALDGRSTRVQGYPEGYYLGPTIFDEVSRDMRIAKEEIFGPVASVGYAESLDEAIETINSNTSFGNMACIFTSSGSAARRFRREVNAGNIGINVGVAFPAAFFPFGGRKESFLGVLHAQIDTVDFFADKKVTISRWS